MTLCSGRSCSFPLRRAIRYRVAGDGLLASRAMTFIDRSGDVVVRAEMGSKAKRVGGVAATVVGGAAALGGLLLLPIAIIADGLGDASSGDRGSASHSGKDFIVGSGVVSALGLVTLGVGIALLVTSGTTVQASGSLASPAASGKRRPPSPPRPPPLARRQFIPPPARRIALSCLLAPFRSPSP